MLKRLALRVAARLVLDWTTWAAIALAVVLAHSGLRHLDPDAALLAHYQTVLGMPGAAYWVGWLQLFVAAALIARRTRVGACAALAAALLIAMALQIAGGRGGDGLLAPLAVLAAALAIGAGARRPRTRQSSRMRT